MRRSEILAVRWLDVDLPSGLITLPQSKNNESKIIYLNQSAKNLMVSLQAPTIAARTIDRVFGGISPTQVTRTFVRVCQKVGIEDFSFHDLRHTTGSWLAMSGKDIYTIAKVLGHKDLG